MEEEEEVVVRRSRWRFLRWGAVGLLLLVILAIAIVWTQRMRIASGYIDRELERRGVRATYEVKGIGFRTQRLENMVIGDPKRPDLTARWVEVDLALGWPKTRVSLITARGVRLYGRIENGKLRLGEVDKLLPPPTGRPFRLPNQRIDIADASMRLDTPAGRVGLAIEGKGNLAYSFEGRIAASSPRLTPGDCVLQRPRAVVAVTTKDDEPSFRGPLQADSITCGTLALAQPSFALRTTLAPALDGWRGSADVRVPQARVGTQRASGLVGRVSFDGDADWTRGTMDLAANATDIEEFRTGRASVEGRYAWSPRSGQLTVLGSGQAQGINAVAAVRPVAQALASAEGTPVDPIGDALAAAVTRFGNGFDARGGITLVNAPRTGAVRFQELTATGRSGARLALEGGEGLTYYWPAGLARIDGQLALAGGGFPAARMSLSQPRPGAPISGEARIAPMAAGGSRLALAPVRFTAGGGGATQIETIAVLDGSFNDGRVTGLTVPIRGRLTSGGGLAFGERCTTVSFQGLQVAGLRLGPSRFPLCPTGEALVWRRPGGSLQAATEVRAPRIAGRLGRTPITLAADRVRFHLGESDFTSSNVAVRLGNADFVNTLDLETLSGRFNPQGVVGTFTGGSGKIGNVPLLLSEAGGTWSVLRGDLALDGRITVADEKQPPRFNPLVSNDFRLTLDDNVINASGWLLDPDTGTRITRATIRHALKGGRGNAILDVPGIAFTENYQPEEITRLTTGVIAIVRGTVTGQGEIRWGPEGTTSTGEFSTVKMDLAAPFGPVTGLTTTLRFTDLLGLETAPGQTAHVDRIQTGIDVLDGDIRYQLLPDLRVRVEAARWPFAGGELLLNETILDFSQPSTKKLTFRVVGLDAPAFIQQMEFSNIAATGTFDGTIPMEFDLRGGRIVGGRLIARPEGGTLSYIGELSDKNLGTYGKLAFDALKSLRYSKFIINLDGSLEGEFLAGIELDGLALNAPTPAGSGIAGAVIGRVLGQLQKIPFEFNIAIRGPFRALIGTARSFEDPTLLIQTVLPEELRDQPTTVTVQPEESETKP